MITLPPADAEALGVRVLERCGASQVSARSTAAALVAADVDGQSGHGLSRLPGYAAQLAAGKIAGAAQPEALRTRSGVFRIDAKLGLAYPALDLAIACLLS